MNNSITEDDIKKTIVLVTSIYEFLSYESKDKNDKGVTINLLKQSQNLNDYIENFNEIMQKFAVLIDEIELNQDDKDSCDIILNSFEKNGINKEFMDDTKTALASNLSILNTLNGTDYYNINKIEPNSCRVFF